MIEKPIYKRNVWTFAFFVVLITVVIYLPTLQNEFINWDDDIYIYKNQNIRSLDFMFLKWMFTAFHAYNWHPLTWFSHAIDYAIWGLNPMGHHLTNVIFHGLNTFLVVLLIMHLINCVKYKAPSPTLPDGRQAGPFIPGIAPQSGAGKEGEHTPAPLSKEEHTSIIAGVVTGLLFGLHPIHVESIAWVSERKDVLYAFFFLLSILFYLKYTSYLQNPTKSTYNYFLCLVFFILSLMSKPMAVTLPVVLIILDIYPLGRLNITSGFGSMKKILAEKIPFFVLSILSSVLTISAQQLLTKSIEQPVGNRLLVSIKALCFYLVKIIFPINLAPIYPYPYKISFWSPWYIGAFVTVIGITTFCIFLWRKYKFYSSAWAFYIVTLLPVLGIIQVGNQAAADRYMYLPSLSPFILIGLLAAWVWEKTSIRKWRLVFTRLLIIIPTILMLFILSVLTIKQIAIWKNTIALLTYELEKFPNFYDVYVSRGITYMNMGYYQQAIGDFNRAVTLNSNNASVFNYRGAAYEKLGNYQQAIQDLDMAINLNPKELLAYYNRGDLNIKLGKYKEATKDFDKSIELIYLSRQCLTPMGLNLNYEYAFAYLKRGDAYTKLGNYQQALMDYNIAIELNPQFKLAYHNREIAYQQSLKDYENAIKQKPQNMVAYVNRGTIHAMIKNYKMALEDYDRAIKLNPGISTVYYNRGLIFINLGKYQQALVDLDTVIKLNPKDSQAYYNRGIAYEKIGNHQQAVKDFQIAARLGDKDSQNYLKSKGISW
jgi:tetratricopeptide (TPR) repeat protein